MLFQVPGLWQHLGQTNYKQTKEYKNMTLYTGFKLHYLHLRVQWFDQADPTDGEPPLISGDGLQCAAALQPDSSTKVS